MGSGFTVGSTAALVRNWDDSELGREMLSKAQLGTVITAQPGYRGRISPQSSADNLGFQRFFSWPGFFNQKKFARRGFSTSADAQNQLCPGGKNFRYRVANC